MNAIFNRSSIRKYQSKVVEKEKIEKILRAAMQAPSAGNQQPWEFIVVQDKAELRKLAEASPNGAMTAEAPLAIVVLGNTTFMKYPCFWEQDLGACTQNILVEACELGLGSVWIGIAPIDEKMLAIKEQFNLTDEKLPYSLIAIGYPAEEKDLDDRYEEQRVTYY